MPTWQRKKYYELAKGFYGRSKNCIRIMAPRVEKSLQYAYRDRQVRPRLKRKEWIISINAGVREHNINYSRFIEALNHSNIQLNRKILSDLAQNEPYSFKAVIDEVKFQGKMEEKTSKDIGYLEALAQGYLIEGKVLMKDGDYKDYKTKFSGYVNEDKMTPEQLREVERK